MGRRERLEARAERRRDWAAKREAKSAAGFARAHRIADGIPLGQPVLVGHHSERHARADIARIDSGMRQGCESADMARTHESKAAGIEDQLSRSIFSDDDNAPEACEARAAEFDASADNANAINKAWRKLKGDREALFVAWQALGVSPARCAVLDLDARQYSWLERTGPMSASHARANARRYRERAKTIRAQAAKVAEAEVAPGGLLVTYHGTENEQARVTFPDYPGRETVQALKVAGFWWSRPSWVGPTAKLPERVRAMLPEGVTP